MSLSRVPPSMGEPPAQSKWSSREVSEYLARWGVEDAVQQAVNSAIKHKAPDPVLHVAKILEEKGREAEAAQSAQNPATALPSSD